MIGFINKFLSSLSDDELSHLRTKVWAEQDRRLYANPGSPGMELSDKEKALVLKDKVIEAIKTFRARNVGMMLKDAKDVVEAYRNAHFDFNDSGTWVPKKKD